MTRAREVAFATVLFTPTHFGERDVYPARRERFNRMILIILRI